MTVARKYMEREFTIEEYRALPEERMEIIDGIVYDLAAPSAIHQSIAGEIIRQLGNYLLGKRCRAYIAPYDVYLDQRTVVQPDITLICDPDKRKKDGCHGTPDMIVEILSPSTAGHDMITKMDLYRKSGVREYWIVDPERKLIQVFLLQDSLYVLNAVYDSTGTAKVNVLEDCKINLSEVFEEDCE